MSWRELAVAQAIDARVAEVADDESIVGEDEDGGSAAHPHLLPLLAAPVEDCPIGVPQGVGDHLERVGALEVTQLFEVGGDDLDGHLAGDLAGRVAAHAVGDHEEAAILVRVGEEVVFVALSDAADVGSGGYGKVHERLTRFRSRASG